MKRSVTSCIVSLFFVGLSSLSANVFARPVTPFYTSDLAPLAGLYGLPALQDARILTARAQRYRLVADLASNYTVGRSDNEELVFDGETTRIIFEVAGNVSRNMELGLRIPYLGYSGGMLDGFVRRWHDVFGLPQGGRDKVANDLLDYRYVRDGETRVSQQEEIEGLGDISVSAGWQLVTPRLGQENALSLRANLKFPTGDKDLLLGSGSTDLAIWLSGGRGGYGLGRSASVYGGLGVLLTTKGNVLPELQRQQVPFASLGAGAWLIPQLALKLQLDYHGALFNGSDLPQLGKDTVQLSMGGSLRLVKNTEIELAVIEDVAVGTSSDVVFHIGITVSE